MCEHLRRRHLAPAPLTLRLQFSQPGLYLIRHRRIEQVLRAHMPPLNENNQESVSERSFFCGSPIEYPMGTLSQRDPVCNTKGNYHKLIAGGVAQNVDRAGRN